MKSNWVKIPNQEKRNLTGGVGLLAMFIIGSAIGAGAMALFGVFGIKKFKAEIPKIGKISFEREPESKNEPIAPVIPEEIVEDTIEQLTASGSKFREELIKEITDDLISKNDLISRFYE